MKDNINKALKIILLLFAILFICIISFSDSKVSIEDFVLSESSNTVDVSSVTFNRGIVNSQILFNEVGSYVTFKFNVDNQSKNQLYKIVSITDNRNENLDIDYDYSGELIKPNEKSPVTMKVTYKNKIKEKGTKTLDELIIKVKVEDNKGREKNITVKPFKDENVILYVFLMIITVLALVFLFMNNNGFGCLFLVIAIILSIFTFSYKDTTFEIVFDNINVKNDIETYTVTINEGENTYTIDYSEKQVIGNLKTPEKLGYTFKEWQDENGNVVDKNTKVTKNMKLTAIFDINNYSINYDLDGGSGSNPSTYTVEDKVVLRNPSKLGYKFIGWTGSNGNNPKTNLVIEKGNTGDKKYKANFILDDETTYSVIHKKMNLDGNGYTVEEIETLVGSYNKEVTPKVKTYEGFTSPLTKTITLRENDSNEVEYLYERNKYELTLEDLNNIDTDITSGEYYYGKEITLKAKPVMGYSFSKWSDGSTDENHTFTLGKDTIIKPIYVPNTNTPYTVTHKKMNIDGTDYDVEEVEHLTGTTDTNVTPSTKSYTGFTAPSTQTVQVKADGSTSVEYLYERNEYTLTLEDTDLIDTTITSGTYYYGTEISVKAKAKQGYTFSKWSTGSTDNDYSFTLEQDTVLKPVYTPNTNTPYTVTHKKMNFYGTDYEVAEEEELSGTTDTNVTPSTKSYVGFTAPSTQTVQIKADGTTHVEYLYERNQYTLTLVNSDYIDTTFTSGDYYYETEISVKAKAKQGYTFVKWSTGYTDSEYTFNMTGNVELEAIYTPNTNTPYTVTHKKMNIDGTDYDVEEVEHLTGTTDTNVTPSTKSYTGFTAPTTETILVKADGSASVEYLYERNQYTLTVTNSDYVTTSTPSGSYYYEKEITLTRNNRAGYTFTNWTSGETTDSITFTMVSNKEVGPVYSPNTNTPYIVIHYKEKLDGTYENVEELHLTGTTDTNISPSVNSYPGFKTPSVINTTINGDESTVVEYYYDRVEYTLTITNEDKVNTTTSSGTYKYEQPIELERKDVTGYHFIKWTNDSEDNTISFTMVSNVTVGPIYEANSYTIRFDANEGEGTMGTIDADYDESVTLLANTFTRHYYLFNSWNTESDGTGDSYDDEAVVSNLTSNNGVTVTLYAIWDLNLPSYTHVDPITFDGNTIIDTGVPLFSEETYFRNFEISLDIVDIPDERFGTTNMKDTIVNSINEAGSPWPGAGLRINSGK